MITETSIVVRYAETDQMGIAHHSNYAVWFEQARTEYIKALGISYSELEARGVMMPLTALYASYKQPAHYEDVLTIRTRTSCATPIRIRLEYEVFCGETLLSVGYTEHAFVDSATFRPKNLKKHQPELYTSLINAIEPPLGALEQK